MAKLSKKFKEEWQFFLNQFNRTTYNEQCKKCEYSCKQSFRAMPIHCPKFKRRVWIMSFYTQSDIARARELELLTYLETYEPDELVKISSGVYSTRTHDILKISNGKWMWWSRGVGGRNALEYLIIVPVIPQDHFVSIYYPFHQYSFFFNSAYKMKHMNL